MNLGKILARFIRPDDVPQLNAWRGEYPHGYLELPHGFTGRPGKNDAVTTVVAEKDGELISSLTAIRAVIFDPFIHDPKASPEDIAVSLVKLETVLMCLAQTEGAVDAFIAVPATEAKYHRLLERHGYKETAQFCKTFRKAIVPDHVPLISDL